jgi:hypothetical protein
MSKLNSDMFIMVEARSNYGSTLYYPVCHRADYFARIAGSATLTPRTLQMIKRLGFDVRLFDTAKRALDEVLKGEA